jgi:hypothetical protein
MADSEDPLEESASTLENDFRLFDILARQASDLIGWRWATGTR